MNTRTRKENDHPLDGHFSFFFAKGSGFEPIAEQTLVATKIFAIGEKANRVLPPQPKMDETMIQVCSFVHFIFAEKPTAGISFITICSISGP